jgi:hypothetical protein
MISQISASEYFSNTDVFFHVTYILYIYFIFLTYVFPTNSRKELRADDENLICTALGTSEMSQCQNLSPSNDQPFVFPAFEFGSATYWPSYITELPTDFMKNYNLGLSPTSSPAKKGEKNRPL